MEEHHQRGVVAAVTELASSLKGWLPNPVRRNKEPQLQAPEPVTLFRSMWDDPTRNAMSLLVAPRFDSASYATLIVLASSQTARHHDASACVVYYSEP